MNAATLPLDTSASAPASALPAQEAERSDPLWSADYSDLDCFPLEDHAVLLAFPMPRGLPRPLWRDLPIPYTVQVVGDPAGARPNLRGADPGRLDECRRQDRCLHCGESLDERCVVIWNRARLGTLVEGPMHPRCARMACAHCPRLARLLREGSIEALEGPLSTLNHWRRRYMPLPEEPESEDLRPHPHPEGFTPFAASRQAAPPSAARSQPRGLRAALRQGLRRAASLT